MRYQLCNKFILEKPNIKQIEQENICYTNFISVDVNFIVAHLHRPLNIICFFLQKIHRASVFRVYVIFCSQFYRYAAALQIIHSRHSYADSTYRLLNLMHQGNNILFGLNSFSILDPFIFPKELFLSQGS